MLDWLKRLFSGTPRPAPESSPFPHGTGPARLVILRHAEKTGEKSDPHLSKAGARRAQRLATWIPETFGRPDFLVAAKTSKRSRRPVETIEPLARALGGLAIADDLDDEQVADLVERLRDVPAWLGKVGVVSWRHSDIPRLVTALGAPPALLGDEWDEADYTTVVDVVFTGTGAPEARRVTMPF